MIDKQTEAQQLQHQWQLREMQPIFPAKLAPEPEHWVAVVNARHQKLARHESAALADRLGAVDARTLAGQLQRVTFTATDQQITSGWCMERRRGFIAKATVYHVGLTKLLLRAAMPHLGAEACTTLLMRRGSPPSSPKSAIRLVAMVRISSVSDPAEAHCTWLSAAVNTFCRDATSVSIFVGVYALPMDGVRDCHAAAKLANLGFQIWKAD